MTDQADGDDLGDFEDFQDSGEADPEQEEQQDSQDAAGREYDEETYVERTDVGVSITTELKRGSGTRDQDKHVLKSKDYSLHGAIDKHTKGMDYLEREVLDRSRNLQPEVQEEEEDD